MQVTTPGQNRTGAAVSPKEIGLMLEAVEELSPPVPISTLQMDVERQGYIAEADNVGSIPPPTGKSKAKKSRTEATTREIFLDKLGERIAFERTGTRLYGALITKYLALTNGGEAALPPVGTMPGNGAEPGEATDIESEETALDTLTRIRAEELGHFHLLCKAVTSVGGDPTAQTPCADVSAAASMGLMQVLTDPRTTLAQCLNTILTAELTDNAGWELLAELAEDAGESAMAEEFLQALQVEQQHLVVIRGWLLALLVNAPGTPAV
jgi:hypothetical protein